MTAFKSRSNARRRVAIDLPGTLLFRWPLLLLLALLPLALGGQPAEAFRGWCMRDPAFKIDGQTAHVLVAVDVAKLRTARALSPKDTPIQVILTVPVGVDATFAPGDNGFGSGYTSRIEYDPKLKKSAAGTPVRVEVLVPMKDPSVQVRVDFVPTMGGAPSTHGHGHGQGHGSKVHGHRPPHAHLTGGYAEGFVNQPVSWPPTP